MAIKKQHGSIGFKYDLNDNNAKKGALRDGRLSPSKKPRITVSTASTETDGDDSDIEPLKGAAKGGHTAKLASKWRWNEHRRQVVISRVVAVNLFQHSVADGSRDRYIRKIVLELNKNTEDDINWILLTFEACRKKVYEIQRKVLKFKDREEMLQLLSKAEQQLYGQLKSLGQVAAASDAKLSADTSLVILR